LRVARASWIGVARGVEPGAKRGGLVVAALGRPGHGCCGSNRDHRTENRDEPAANLLAHNHPFEIY
jgi:hypothetical protein